MYTKIIWYLASNLLANLLAADSSMDSKKQKPGAPDASDDDEEEGTALWTKQSWNQNGISHVILFESTSWDKM